MICGFVVLFITLFSISVVESFLLHRKMVDIHIFSKVFILSLMAQVFGAGNKGRFPPDKPGVHIIDSYYSSSKCVVENTTMTNGLLSGTVSSYVDPITKKYLPNTYCTILINVPEGSGIYEKVTSLNLEWCDFVDCPCDYVELTTSVKHTGTRCCRPSEKEFEISFLSYMFIRFWTDGANEKTDGFTITWKEMRSPGSCTSPIIIANSSGIIQAPVDFKGNVLDFQKCIWYFQAPPDYVWEFTYLMMDLPSDRRNPFFCDPKAILCVSCLIRNDEALVLIFEDHVLSGDGVVGTKLGTTYLHSLRCSDKIPNEVITSIGPTSGILFKAGTIITSLGGKNRTGFKIYYRQLPAPCTSLRIIAGNLSGIVEPDLQENGRYRANENCQWSITSDQHLTFTKFEFENCRLAPYGTVNGSSCDRLVIYDGNTIDRTRILGEFDGNQPPDNGSFFISSGHTVLLHFSTNRRYEFAGFTLAYHGIESDNIACQRTVMVLEGKGSLQNHRKQDGSYRENEDCNWHINIEAGYFILFTIRHLDVQSYDSVDICPGDWLAIYDGRDKSSYLLKRLCGKSDDGSVQIQTTGSEALVSFRTDNTNDGSTGFQIDYETIKKEDVNKQADSAWLVITLSTVISSFAIIIVTSIIIAVLTRRRKKRQKKLEDAMKSLNLNSYITPAPNFQSLLREVGAERLFEEIERLNVREELLAIGPVLGHGNFGIIYKGELHQQKDHLTINNEQAVAIKVVKSSKPDDLVDLIKEAVVMSEFDHEHVMKLIGISIIQETPHLIFPYMANGSLREFLCSSKLEVIFDSKLLREFCRQICLGMIYITESGYIHRDLAARNVLLSDELKIKISDFGLSRNLNTCGYYRWMRQEAVPVRWHPPESFQMSYFDSKSDVWSFGVVCWEIFSLCKTDPYPELKTEEVGIFIQKGNRLPKPDNCSEDFYCNVMLNCWLKDRFKRPTFQTLLSEIDYDSCKLVC